MIEKLLGMAAIIGAAAYGGYALKKRFDDAYDDGYNDGYDTGYENGCDDMSDYNDALVIDYGDDCGCECCEDCDNAFCTSEIDNNESLADVEASKADEPEDMPVQEEPEPTEKPAASTRRKKKLASDESSGDF